MDKFGKARDVLYMFSSFKISRPQVRVALFFGTLIAIIFVGNGAENQWFVWRGLKSVNWGRELIAKVNRFDRRFVEDIRIVDVPPNDSSALQLLDSADVFGGEKHRLKESGTISGDNGIFDGYLFPRFTEILTVWDGAWKVVNRHPPLEFGCSRSPNVGEIYTNTVVRGLV